MIKRTNIYKSSIIKVPFRAENGKKLTNSYKCKHIQIDKSGAMITLENSQKMIVHN